VVVGVFLDVCASFSLSIHRPASDRGKRQADAATSYESLVLSFRQKVESPVLSKRRFCAFDWPKRRSACLGLSSLWRNDHTRGVRFPVSLGTFVRGGIAQHMLTACADGRRHGRRLGRYEWRDPLGKSRSSACVGSVCRCLAGAAPPRCGAHGQVSWPMKDLERQQLHAPWTSSNCGCEHGASSPAPHWFAAVLHCPRQNNRQSHGKDTQRS